MLLVLSGGAIAKSYLDKETSDLLDAASISASKTDKTVIATVNGEEIYQETLDFLEAGQQFSARQATHYAAENNYSAPQVTPLTKDELLKNQIRQIVILQAAKASEITADYEENYRLAKENYDALKKAEDDNTRFIEDYMNKLGLSEKEYLKQSALIYQNLSIMNTFYNQFKAGKTGTENELKAAYESYVTTLIEKADIQYR